MTFSYTQIAQYLRCPRSYRHRYLDGWREKDIRASLLFGRCFEKALAAFFAGRTALPLYSRNGECIKTRSSSMRVEMTGTGCFAKASACWNDWLRMIVFAFNSLATICR